MVRPAIGTPVGFADRFAELNDEQGQVAGCLTRHKDGVRYWAGRFPRIIWMQQAADRLGLRVSRKNSGHLNGCQPPRRSRASHPARSLRVARWTGTRQQVGGTEGEGKGKILWKDLAISGNVVSRSNKKGSSSLLAIPDQREIVKRPSRARCRDQPRQGGDPSARSSTSPSVTLPLPCSSFTTSVAEHLRASRVSATRPHHRASWRQPRRRGSAQDNRYKQRHATDAVDWKTATRQHAPQTPENHPSARSRSNGSHQLIGGAAERCAQDGGREESRESWPLPFRVQRHFGRKPLRNSRGCNLGRVT